MHLSGLFSRGSLGRLVGNHSETRTEFVNVEKLPLSSTKFRTFRRIVVVPKLL